MPNFWYDFRVLRPLLYRPSARIVQYQLMSQSGWYHDKAANCERMALASVDTAIRARDIKDRDNWLEIAARIDAAEEAVKSRKI